MFFHKYSLNCMALFFLSLLTIYFFFHKYSLKCTAIFLDINVEFIDNFNFLKDNETIKSVIKGNDCILCRLYRFISSWTSSILGQIGQNALLSVEFYSGENTVDTITPLTRTGIKSWTS